MRESKALFEQILSTNYFDNATFLLFFNKVDILKEKVLISDLCDYFPEFDGPRHDFDSAMNFIRNFYLPEYDGTRNKMYTHFTTATGKYFPKITIIKNFISIFFKQILKI